jgi:methionyl-tRNA synthetase
LARDRAPQRAFENAALDELRAAFETSGTADEFADRILVGDCPKCGSQDTGNCEADPEIENLLVGRCYQCGQL